MPRGLNRTDLNTTGQSYRNGTPITLPHEFGNPITLPHDFGNEPPFDAGNPVTWTPSPAYFGNLIGQSSGNYIVQVDGTSKFLLAGTSGALLLA